ncbi:MAG: PAS domain S-box protein [Chloroflexaceae bacterium]|nr:PAS domain S-box protein [Chloroflexaceae bacterium]
MSGWLGGSERMLEEGETLTALQAEILDLRRRLADVEQERDRLQRECDAAHQQVQFQDHILQGIGQAVMATRLDGTIIYWNRSAEAMYGWQADEVLGRNILDITPAADWGEYAVEIMEQLRAGEVWSGEFYVQRRDGTTFYALVQNVPVTDEHGVLTSIIGISSDITAQKQAAERLQASEYLLQQTQRIGRIGGWELDIATQQVTWTDEVYRIHEVPLEYEPEIDEAIRFYAPQSVPMLQQALAQAMNDGSPFDLELAFITAQGRPLWVRAQGNVLFADDRPWKVIGTFQDMTVRRQFEEQLQLTQFALDQAPDGVAFLNEAGDHLYVNDALCRMLGYDRATLLTLHVSDIDPALVPPVWQQIWQQMREQETVIFEGEHRRRDGSVFAVEIASHFVAFREQVYLCSFTRDITERKRVELALKQSEERYRLLFDGSINPLAVCDRDGILVLINKQAARNLDSTVGECIGKPLGTFVPTFHDRTVIRIREVLSTKKVLFVEDTIELSQGQRWFWSLLQPIKMSDGLELVQIISHDITERKQAEELLRASEERLRTLVQAMPVMLDAFDAHGLIVAWNAECERVTGYSAAEVIGNSQAMQMFYPDQGYRDAMEQTVFEVELDFRNMEWDLTRKDGSICTISWSNISKHYPIAGWASWAIGIDVTEQKQIERALKHSRDAAEAASRTKSAFLANMSHEIRTPLNAILPMTQVLLETNLTAEQHEAVITIATGSKALLALISDILDISRIEQGSLVLQNESFDFFQCVREAAALFAPQAATKHLALVVQIDETLPHHLIGDIVRLRQVIINLVSNAVKFTDTGSIAIDVSGQPQEHGWQIDIAVRDTGIGISAEVLPLIFDAFTQADTSMTRRYGGSGLGLAISRQLITLMGGSLDVASHEGRGSTFTISLLTEAADQPFVVLPQMDRVSEPAVHDQHHRPLRILLAEDSLLNQRVMLRLLEKRGYRADVALNGQEVLACLQQQHYDLILMDVQMPEMDGIEATRRIRAEWPAEEQPWIIAITAHALEGDREWCLAAGMDDYLSKPVQSEQLFAAIQQVK